MKASLELPIHFLKIYSHAWGIGSATTCCRANRGGGQRETVRRIRKQEGLQVMKTVCKRRPLWASTPTPTRAAHPHHVWSDDVVHDETTDGRRLKCLTVLDEYPREG
jgi:hypothetical protein